MAGEYRLGRLLGEGGFGAVYEAEHPVLKRRAAVKILHRVADKDSDAVQRFIAEAQAVNQIKNRHIIDIFSFGKLADGRHFYVMDLLEGEPLDRFLEHTGRVDVSTTLQLLQPIADALDQAHAAGIIHRDLKPQNIFLAWEPSGETTPKLLDFGMAKLLGNSPVRTISGTPIGTPLYMSPEQARGDKVDGRSDVYALGVLCYEMLTGRLPFQAETTIAVLMAHLVQVPERPSDLCADLPEGLNGPLLAMLEKDPASRPGSAGEALAALRYASVRAGIVTPTGLPRLPRPEKVPSEEFEEAPGSSGPGELATTEGVAVKSAQSGSSRTRVTLFVVGAALFVLGALGVFLMRSQAPQAEPDAAVPQASAPPAPSPAASPSAAAPAPSASAAPAEPGASTTVPSPRRAPEPKTKKVAPPAASGVPRDLESPF
ncbi:MAG TPA: serine/threonine-protein kinase [Polyangiaceae bacterium]|nr:serine/threonine-protein kinase [Polyangiaceae bacterium]